MLRGPGAGRLRGRRGPTPPVSWSCREVDREVQNVGVRSTACERTDASPDAGAKRGRGELAAHSRGLPANSRVLPGELRRRRERNRLPPRAHRQGANVTRRERARSKFTGKTANGRAMKGARACNGRRERGLRRIRRRERLSRKPVNGVPPVYFGELEAVRRRRS